MNTAKPLARAAAAAVVVCALGACAKAKVTPPVEAVPEKPPEPPTDPLAWLPGEASVLARLDLSAFRQSPIYRHVPDLDDTTADWLELDAVDQVSVAVEPRLAEDPSVVGVLSGGFEDGYLRAHATELGAVVESHGGRDVYLHEGTYWMQPRANLLVGFTGDNLDWILDRHTAGADAQAPLRRTDVYGALADAAQFDSAHLAVLVQDEDGSLREVLKQAGAQASIMQKALQNVYRGAARVRVDQGLSVGVYADVDSELHATQLKDWLQAYVDRWKRNPLVLMLGLGELLQGITLDVEGARLVLDAEVTQQEIDAMAERLGGLLEGLFEGPKSPPVAPQARSAQPGSEAGGTGTGDAGAVAAPEAARGGQ